MNELLLEIAGFLNLIAQGHIPVPEHAKREAVQLLQKIGDAATTDPR